MHTLIPKFTGATEVSVESDTPECERPISGCFGGHSGVSVFREIIMERFWNKVKRAALEDCWEWQGCRNPKGYGQIKTTVGSLAHRFSFFLHYGELPYGYHVCHRCDNPRCVNPNHLFLGTDMANQHDSIAKGRARKARGTAAPTAKLTPFAVREIRARFQGGETNRSPLDRDWETDD